MKNVSYEYKNAIRAPSRHLMSRIVVKGKINTEITDSNIESIEIDNSVLSNDKFVVGGGIASTITISLNNYQEQLNNINFENKWINVYFKIELENSTWEEVYYGTYWIEEAKITGKKISLEGYDLLGKLDKKYKCKINYPALISAIVEDMQNVLNVEFGDNLKNANYNFNNLLIKNKPGGTFRQVLTDIAAINGGFLTCIQDVIDIKYFSNSDISINKDNAFKITTNNTYMNLTGVNINKMLSGDSDGTVMTLEIALLDGISEKNIAEIARYILNMYKDMTYLGFSSEWQGDYAMDVCDKIIVNDKEEVESIVTNNKITYKGGLKATTEAKINKDEIEATTLEVQMVEQELNKNNGGVYYYTNDADLSIADKRQLCFFEYTTSSSANLVLLVSIQLKGTATVQAEISIGNSKVLFSPKVSINGEGLLSFSYPVLQQGADEGHSLAVTLVTSSAMTIEAEQAQIILYGQRLVGGLDSSKPHAEVAQNIKYIPMNINVNTNALVNVQVPIPSISTENILYTNELNAKGINSNVLITMLKKADIIVTDSKCYYDNATSIIGTVNTKKDDYIIATISATGIITIPPGWILLKTIGTTGISTLCFIYKKIDTEINEIEVTITQSSESLCYLNLISVSGLDNIEYANEFEVISTEAVTEVITHNKATEKLIWGCSAYDWIETGEWQTERLEAISIKDNVPVLANFMDIAEDNVTRTFLINPSSKCLIGALKLTQKDEEVII